VANLHRETHIRPHPVQVRKLCSVCHVQQPDDAGAVAVEEDISDVFDDEGDFHGESFEGAAPEGACTGS